MASRIISAGGETMSNESHNRAVQRYMDKTYDRIAIRVKKGKRDEWKKAAADLGLSLAGLVVAGVDEYIERHKTLV